MNAVGVIGSTDITGRIVTYRSSGISRAQRDRKDQQGQKEHKGRKGAFRG